jgi:hypothetical protein
MRLVFAKLLASAALALFAGMLATPASAVPVVADLEFTGDDGHGTGTVAFDAGAQTDGLYTYGAGDTLVFTLKIGDSTVIFTENDVVFVDEPPQILLSGGALQDVRYLGFLQDVAGDIDTINLRVGFGTWNATGNTDEGFEFNIGGEFRILGDTSGETPVPEPASALLFAAGLAAVGWMRRRRA